MRLRSSKGLLPGIALVPALAITTALAAIEGPPLHAEDATADKTELAERCAIRLSIALTGKSPTAEQMKSPTPQAGVDAMLASPDFPERYARFINAQFNGGPADDATDDPIYYLAKEVITNDKPWSDLFIGPYSVTSNGTTMDVTEDDSGLGYFRTTSWRKRYAGNEDQGYMLSGAFRILSNTTGLALTPSVGQPGDDRTVTGRQAAPCNACHFQAWYALDKFAKLLPKRKGQGDSMTFTDPTEGPQQLLGKTIADDKELLTTLVDSDSWRFQQCRNVFLFLEGRPENQCEAPIFDKCVDALSQQKTIRAAVAAVAKDPGFCR
jgi:hypothetical protein